MPTRYTNKKGQTILDYGNGFRISQDKLDAKYKAQQEYLANLKCPPSLLRELQSAIDDGCEPDYVAYLKEKIDRYKG